VKTSESRRCLNGTAGLRAQGNLREKRPDPWLRANALPKAAADPELKVQTRTKIAGVSAPGSQAGGATTSPSELKSLTQNSAPQGTERPCYEAENSACRGE